MKKRFLVITTCLLSWSAVFVETANGESDTLQAKVSVRMVTDDVNSIKSSGYTRQEFRRGRGQRLGMVAGISTDSVLVSSTGKGSRRMVIHRIETDEPMRFKYRGNPDKDSVNRPFRIMQIEGPEQNIVIVRPRGGNPQLVSRPMRSQPYGSYFGQHPRRIRQNIIDLSDENVISFKKRKMSGGREKITIIRKEVDDSLFNQKIDPQQELFVPQRQVRELEIEPIPGNIERRIRIRVDSEVPNQ